MVFCGIQKLTLLDYPGKTACTLFSGGCDFRCPFCHNFELVTGGVEPAMDTEELVSFLEKRRSLLDGVVFSGGEPCLHADLPDCMRRVKDMGFLVKLDTNGHHPDMLRRVSEQGLVDYIAMDIKNSPEKYAQTAGIPGDRLDMSRIRESISLIMEAPDYEFRTTVVGGLHEEADFHGIGELIRGAKRYFLQPFTDRDTVPDRSLAAPTAEELAVYRDIMREYVEEVSIRGV